jgi:hypothetical protein
MTSRSLNVLKKSEKRIADWVSAVLFFWEEIFRNWQMLCWLKNSKQLIGRTNCTEVWACLGLNQRRYTYPSPVPLLLGLWAAFSCSPECRNSGIADSYRN